MRLIDAQFSEGVLLWRSPSSRSTRECPAGQRMTWRLRNQGLAVNENRIRRLRREMAICQKLNTRNAAICALEAPDRRSARLSADGRSPALIAALTSPLAADRRMGAPQAAPPAGASGFWVGASSCGQADPGKGRVRRLRSSRARATAVGDGGAALDPAQSALGRGSAKRLVSARGPLDRSGIRIPERPPSTTAGLHMDLMLRTSQHGRRGLIPAKKLNAAVETPCQTPVKVPGLSSDNGRNDRQR